MIIICDIKLGASAASYLLLLSKVASCVSKLHQAFKGDTKLKCITSTLNGNRISKSKLAEVFLLSCGLVC